MVLKLYGSNDSHPALRVAHILKEKRVPFEFVPVDLAAKEHKTPEYLQKHPFGQVPYIDDDGFILYESRAICKYIATKWQDQGVQLVPDPADLTATALFDQALSVEQNNFDPIAWSIILEIKYKPRKGQTTDAAVVGELIDKLEEKLTVYDAILSKQNYLAGENLTLADIYHLAWGTVLVDELGVNVLLDESKRPYVTRWWKDISSRPDWLTVKNGI